MTRSIASSICFMLISSLFSRTAKIADSFNTFSRSAPENPGVRFAKAPKSKSFTNFLLRACTCRIASLPLRSGSDTVIWRSKRPARNNAGSSTSGLFVAAITTTPVFSSIPSISTSNWFSVCSRSSCPPPKPAPRWRPTASISSMKIIHGAVCCAFLNISRTRLAPTPTNISTKSEPEIL